MSVMGLPEEIERVKQTSNPWEKKKTQCSQVKSHHVPHPHTPCARSYGRHEQGQKDTETARQRSSGRADGRGQYPRTECLANVHSSLRGFHTILYIRIFSLVPRGTLRRMLERSRAVLSSETITVKKILDSGSAFSLKCGCFLGSVVAGPFSYYYLTVE